MENTPRLDRARLSVLVALIFLVGVVLRVIQLPEVSRSLNVLGSPLEIRITGTWFFAVLAAGLAAMGTRYVLAGHPAASGLLPRPLYLSWVLPALLGGMAAYLLGMTPSEGLWTVGVVSATAIIGLAVAAEFGSLSPDHPGYARSRLALNLLAYTLAFGFFYAIYQTRARSIITASGITLICFLIALDLLSVADVKVGRVVLYAGIVALLTGEATWALNYWRLSDWVAGILILVVFYWTTGVAHQNLLNRLSPRVLLEYGLVTALALSAILFLSP